MEADATLLGEELVGFVQQICYLKILLVCASRGALTEAGTFSQIVKGLVQLCCRGEGPTRKED